MESAGSASIAPCYRLDSQSIFSPIRRSVFTPGTDDASFSGDARDPFIKTGQACDGDQRRNRLTRPVDPAAERESQADPDGMGRRRPAISDLGRRGGTSRGHAHGWGPTAESPPRPLIHSTEDLDSGHTRSHPARSQALRARCTPADLRPDRYPSTCRQRFCRVRRFKPD